jgi:aryl-alcohol dehydrogenase-like predicted oxidoreductase
MCSRFTASSFDDLLFRSNVPFADCSNSPSGISSTEPRVTITARSIPFCGSRMFRKNLDLVGRIEEIAKEKGCSPAQLALAWVLAQGKDIVPIPGTKRRKYLEENVAALDVDLTEEDLRRIDEIAPQGIAAGARYQQAMMHLVNR